MGTNQRVGFVGLGNMGSPMAKNLAQAGFRLRVWDRTLEKAKEILRDLPQAELCNTPREAAEGSQFVVSSLANDEAVRAVTFGPDGTLSGMAEDCIRVEASTISVALSQELESVHSKAQRRFVAAPVFGRPEAAAQRQLWIVAGGPPDALERCAPLFAALGQGTFRFARPPQANLIKLVGNLTIASLIEVLGEVLALAEKGGIAPGETMQVLSSVFQSPVLKGYGSRIATQSYRPAGFRMNLGFKDITLALRAGEDLRVPLPVASLIHDHFVEALALGRGDLDWSAMATVMRDAAGLSMPATTAPAA
jgi:3-hydroxyisobutyrate dehydrogenase-like beta-hydroxyacid dehydrogenase